MTASLLDLKFIGALILIVLLRRIWPNKYYVLFGTISSALIIGMAAPKTLLVICGITFLFILPMQTLSQLAGKIVPQNTISTYLMPAGVVGLVILLAIFKIHRQFTVPWLGGPWLRENILSLIGFSYFIFRAISYMHIQIILKSKTTGVLEPLFYFLFPPTITSGPIQKYQDFRRQIETPLPLSTPLIWNAAYRVTRGYFRKEVIAVILNGIVQRLLARPQPSAFISIMVLFLLYLFFYFDFAGYSDIAIGFGLLLGIQVPENFRKPFTATSVSEFWRNWHITLVDWFRDHIFITFGGMRGSRFQAASLAFLIMLLCGFWHGLTISFIAWGIWHGVNIFAEAMIGVKPIPPGNRSGIKYWLRVFVTNARVAAACLFFLPDSKTMLSILRGFSNWSL